MRLRADVQAFIDEQVSRGRFPTAEAVIEAAIEEARAAWDGGDVALDDEDVAAINEAEAQADRGEGWDLDAFRARMLGRGGPG